MDGINQIPTNTTSPFEIEIPANNGCCESNNRSVMKQKRGFWQSLFGERKCKYCSLKKSECLCKLRKDSNLQSDIELKSTSTQTCVHNRGSVQGKGHRGCGVHLHFCIEPKAKKDNMKSSSVLRCSNVKMNTNVNQRQFSQSSPSAFIWHQEPVAELTNEAKEPLEEVKIIPPYQPKHADNIVEKENPLFSKTEHIVMQTNDTKPTFNEYAASKEDKYKSEPPKELELKENINSMHHENEPFQQDQPKKGKCPCDKSVNKQSERLEQHAEKELKQPEEVNNIRTSILRKPMFNISKENLVFSLIPHTSDNFKDIVDKDMENNGVGDVEELVAKVEQEKVNQDIKNDEVRKFKKISRPARSTFVRNSLIDVRREKKTIILEEKISIILSKLNSIEDKILELEKDNSCGTSDDITISCNSKKSTVSIEFGKKEKPSSKGKPFVTAAAPSKPPRGNINNTVKLTSKTENVYINQNRNISVVKQFKRNPKQVVCFNPYELDAHSLASNSYLNTRNSDCKNQQVIIQCSAKTNKSTFCDKWRRISEELKISDSDLTK